MVLCLGFLEDDTVLLFFIPTQKINFLSKLKLLYLILFNQFFHIYILHSHIFMRNPIIPQGLSAHNCCIYSIIIGCGFRIIRCHFHRIAYFYQSQRKCHMLQDMK